jgi:glycosyltransferase involved in cell wall biosynthesis
MDGAEVCEIVRGSRRAIASRTLLLIKRAARDPRFGSLAGRVCPLALRTCGGKEGSMSLLSLLRTGKGPMDGWLAHKLDLNARVSFPGFVSYDAVSDLFRAADIFIMPSVVHYSGDRDGIPTVIMESLMHRVPVIATNVSGIPELIEDGVTGLLIPEKDPAAIARAVKRLASDRTSALAMAERGRDKVRNLFDPERNHKKVLELYGTLVAR